MKNIQLNNKNYLLVEVPDDAYDFQILSPNYENWDGNYLVAKPDTHLLLDKVYKNSHQIIGKLSDILKDEDICKGLIEDCSIYAKCWKNYTYNGATDIGGQFNSAYSCWSATDSFLSWAESIELDLSKNWVLIQKL